MVKAWLREPVALEQGGERHFKRQGLNVSAMTGSSPLLMSLSMPVRSSAFPFLFTLVFFGALALTMFRFG